MALANANVNLTLCEATARSTKLRKMQFYKSVFYQTQAQTQTQIHIFNQDCRKVGQIYLSRLRSWNIRKNEARLLITTLPCLKVFASLITKNKSKSSWHTESLPNIVSKISHQEECVQSAKTEECIAPCVTSQVLQVTDKFPSFPSKAEFSQMEG